jgi:hypothetical protein
MVLVDANTRASVAEALIAFLFGFSGVRKPYMNKFMFFVVPSIFVLGNIHAWISPFFFSSYV